MTEKEESVNVEKTLKKIKNGILYLLLEMFILAIMIVLVVIFGKSSLLLVSALFVISNATYLLLYFNDL